MVDMGIGSRKRRSYVITLAAALLALVVVLASCMLNRPEPTARAVVDEFVSALNDGDVAAAGERTSYPNAAEETLQQVFDGLDPKQATFELTQFMDLGPSSSFFTMTASWNFGEGKDWSYQVQAGVRNLSVGWRISWDPTVVAPMLGNGRLVRYDRTDAAPPLVFDNTGALLMNEQTINSIVLDPATMPDPIDTTHRLAAAIAPVAPLITAESMLTDLRENPGEQVTAVRLRDADFTYLENRFDIPGVVVVKEPTLITADRRISTPLLDPLRRVWQANRDESAGWAVHVVEPDGTLLPQAGFQGPPGPDIAATLDSRIQIAAIEAVVSAGTPAAVVAIQPSTGAVLAAAQNNQAFEQGSIAFEGLNPAGNALDLVRQAAALDRGVDEKDLSIEDVEETARRLGLGLDYRIPGLDQQTAVFTSARDGMDQAMATRDDDLPAVTPFGMAMLAASIARGSAPTPMIVHGQPAETDQRAEPLPAHVLDHLRGAMRDNVTHGPGALLRGVPDLLGMTARSDDDRWFFGSQGDLAFAVYVADADGGDRAVQMTDRFFRELAKPPAG
ncbi:penicillin-binding protein [Rhodococcus triatomae]|uniref:beta-lactamase n=1 Tax=Rhodococcus triatomae TaxID=300028 RepID=A0A1G8GPA1_9NOCA|nr:NTF2-like N-terminal transpeptidase domain-containing protein [Rhodococcus triatomae]QNG21524.1 penicillin-binding protein [Rhodococcus triatomae]QNG25737.1 penicillin-binding protein [Rhodococcus triatomae]SDH96202.1 Cell division protein FtsI/penicillin-binding protein 2 [Rhodococcus triatomae]